jgi:hypothetical protein
MADQELALFRRETIDGNRVVGVMRAVIGDDLGVTYIIKTALVYLTSAV